MSISLALNNALSGLAINQRALSTISHNISNANTEGYSRQIVDLSAVYYDSVGSGVRVDDIVRKVDTFLINSVRQYTSAGGRTGTIEDYLERAQILLGEPGEENSIDEFTQSYFDALQDLAETPDRISFRENAVNTGQVLAREVSSLAYGIEELRLQADSDIKTGLRNVNEKLRELDALNVAISRADALGQPKAGLEDKIDMALKSIAEYMDISVIKQEYGGVFVHTNGTAGSISLLDHSLHQLEYTPIPFVDQIIAGDEVNPIHVVTYDERGNRTNFKQELVSGGFESSITTGLRHGSLKGLLEVRDTLLPNALAQLDEFAATLRDTMNAIHNTGTSYPGVDTLTGTRSFTAADTHVWEGEVMIAVLDAEGDPVSSHYTSESNTGYRPLTLDLSYLDSGLGDGAGKPQIQTIIDEINNHFNPPPVKAQLGNLKNIQLVSDNLQLPQGAGTFNFDLDLENISKNGSDVFITGITVLDNTGTDITNITQNVPQTNLNLANTYTTTAGSNIVQVNASGHSFAAGDRIFLSDPGAAVNGVANALLSGFFEVQNVTENSFEIQIQGAATATGLGTALNPTTATGVYHAVDPGEKTRTRDSGTIGLDFSANTGSTYYDITVNLGVDDTVITAAEIPMGQITYRVYNFTEDLYNKRYHAEAVTGSATRQFPNTSQHVMRAIMVDANGNEIPKVDNGKYVPDRTGFLQLITNDPTHTVAIDSLSSKEVGTPNALNQTDPGTNRGFSHFFELNNFFESNDPTPTGDTKDNSAVFMAVEDRFDDDANLISLGGLTRSNQPADPDADPLYTYARYNSDNTIIQNMAKAGIAAHSFTEAGGLASTTQTFVRYTGDILAYGATASVRAENDNTNTNILLDGFTQRSDTFSGVNIDEELANMIIYQNAYTASARIITVADEMFDTLLNAI